MRTDFFFLLLLAYLLGSCSQKPVQEIETPAPAANNIRHYLSEKASEITENALVSINSKEDWEQIRAVRHRELVEMLGLVDVPLEGKRSPLNIKKVGTIKENGYRIEKLYYESLPGLYVPANLYIPDNISEPAPAILYQCGHSRSQKVHYQNHPRRYAELGFVCLIVETIQWGEVKGDHWGCYSRGWFNWYSRGYHPGGVEAWNGIRGLDLLSAMPEVDADKLGVTGISGGGALTWYIAALDSRIKAAATVCGNSTLADQIRTRTIDGHCDCMYPINTYQRDFHDLGALIAPRPPFIAQADRDGLNTIESSLDVFAELKDFYSLYDAQENINFISTPGGHSYHPNSRKVIFSFFLDHLMDKKIRPEDIDDVEESPVRLLVAEELMVYTEGPPANDITTTIQDSFVSKATPPNISTVNELNKYRELTRDELEKRTFGAFPDSSVAFDSNLEFRTLDRAQYGSEIHSFNSEAGWRLKVDIRYRNLRDRKRPLMLVLRNPDELRWESESFISDLENEWNIAYLEVRGVGELGWAPELQWHVRRASAWTGRTLSSMRTYDVLRALDFLRGLKDIDPNKIGIAARDEMASVAMFAALLDGKCTSIVLKDPPATLDVASRPDGRGEAIELLNVLQITDLNQLPAILAPTNTHIIGTIPSDYQWSADVLSKLKMEAHFQSIRSMKEL